MKLYKPTIIKKAFLALCICIQLLIGFAVFSSCIQKGEITLTDFSLGTIFLLWAIYSFYFSRQYFFMKTAIEQNKIIHRTNKNKLISLNSTDISEIKEYLNGNLGDVSRVPGGQEQSLRQKYYIEVLSKNNTLVFNNLYIGKIEQFSEDLKSFSERHDIKWTVIK